ncbi:unnamed protein product [Chrysoparadoxa australica]
MKYAIIEAGGCQHWVEPRKFIDLNLLPLKPGTKILIKRVLFVRDGDNISIGQPYVSSAKIEATVSKHFLGTKVLVYKMKPKKKYRRKQGHRQKLTRLFIDDIN